MTTRTAHVHDEYAGGLIVLLNMAKSVSKYIQSKFYIIVLATIIPYYILQWFM
jgi:hypothetical protein